MVSAYQRQCILNFTQSPLAQDVKFMKAYIFCNDHIKLGRWKAFGRHEGRCAVVYAIIGNKNPSCMYAQMTWKTLYISAVSQYKVREMVQVSAIEFSYAKLVNLVFWETEHLS